MDLNDWRPSINHLDTRLLPPLNQPADPPLQLADLKPPQDAAPYPPQPEAETFPRLIDSDVLICGELRLEITQNLLPRAGALDGVKRVLSHPQGLAQCRGWLAAHLPDVTTEQALSTAAAAEMAAVDATVAAIASDLAAELYGVPVLP